MKRWSITLIALFAIKTTGWIAVVCIAILLFFKMMIDI